MIKYNIGDSVTVTMEFPFPPTNAKYPTYAITDPNGEVVREAVGTNIGGNTFTATYIIPSDAEAGQYSVKWVCLSKNNRQVERESNFEVGNDAVEEILDSMLVGINNKPNRLGISLPYTPHEFKVEVYDASDAIVHSADLTSGLSSTTFGGMKYYYVDITLPIGSYNILYSHRRTPIDIEVNDFASLRVVSIKTLKHMQSLRIMIDRFNKRADAPQAYKDSDILEFLDKGLQMINSWHPAFQPNLTYDIIQGFEPFLMCAAAVWGLQSQFLLETDLAFNFSGASTSLDYDRTSNIDSAYSKALEFLNNNLTKAKTAAMYSSSANGIGSGLGVTGVRGNTARSFRQRVFNITDTGTPGTNLYKELGLL